MLAFFIGIFLIFFSGFFALLFSEKFKLVVASFISILGLIICSSYAFYPLWANEPLGLVIKEFNPLFGAITFNVDLLSSIFIGIISIISILGLIYSNGYLKHYEGKSLNSHIIFLTTLIASMLLVVTSTNALMFLICWEVMSLSSFFLVIFENEKKEVIKAGVKYLVFMHISVLFIIFAFALISIKTGNFDFNSFKNVLENNSQIANLALTLAIIGFGVKAGFIPFHNWLPEAHPAAPTHVSGLMSGVMIKTGIYGILRMLTLAGTPSQALSFVVLFAGLISALYGIISATNQKNIKRLLAYSSIENIGIIGIGIGVGMLGLSFNFPPMSLFGFLGAILHTINHSVFKTLLFFLTGNVYLKCHTKNIESFGGLMKKMPKTGKLFLLGSIAICALPPFNGFVSEFIIYASMFVGLESTNFFVILTLLFSIAILALVGSSAIICFTKAFSTIFLGTPRSEVAENITSDSEKTMLIPTSILGIFVILLGVSPILLFNHITPNMIIDITNSAQAGKDFGIILFLMQTIATISAIFIIFLFTLIVLKRHLTKNKISKEETWGCGYNRANNKMQYSASSFAHPFIIMFRPLFKNIFDIEKPKGFFPKSAHYSSQTEDFEEAYLIHPVVKFDEWFLSKFETMQSGNIQSYIKYSLIFLALIIIGSLFIG
ncbi:hypothetical protein IKA92_05930 [bacterium]|nr:hypothetical protein [bacterium]